MYIKKQIKKILRRLILSVFIILLLPLTILAKNINIVSVNDFHGYLMEYGDYPGMAKLVTVLKNEVKRHPNTIIVFGGDNYEGSPLSSFTQGAPVTDMMREVGVVASAIGNHEFYNGIVQIKKWAKDGKFVFLAANIFNKKTDQPVKWAQPYLIVKKAGIKIAFIGLATQETPYTTKHKYVADLVFKDPAICAQHWIDYLKAGKDPTGKPDVIIALTHIPSQQDLNTGKIIGSRELFSLCNNTRGLDAVISAHSHLIVSGYVNHIPVIQAYSYGRAIGHLIIVLNKQGKVVKIIPQVDLIYKWKNKIKPDVVAQARIIRYVKLLPANMHEVIGVATTTFYRHPSYSRVGQLQLSPLGAWICEAMRQHFHTQIGMLNIGAVRDILPAGKITRLQVMRFYPFQDNAVTLKISGASLYKMLNKHVARGLQFAGIKVFYDRRAKLGRRVVKVTLSDGTLIDKHKYYSVVATQFMLGGGDKMGFPDAIDIKDTQQKVIDALVDFIKQQKKISPPRENNLVVL
jgi:2',3'-cyclic-nucleotide 2'-phosphodiesterase/3'-nucleotidase